MTLLHDNCLDALSNIEPSSIDLIYADPPFYTQKHWGQFDDRWKSLESYLGFVESVLAHCLVVLKDTGSIYWHCDWRTSHHVRLLLDNVFGASNFRNEIVWCYTTSGKSKTCFNKKHDTLLFFSKTQNFFWGKYSIPVSEKYLHSHYRQRDQNGNRCRIRVDAGKERTYYPEEGMTCNDWWADIPYVNSQSKERLHYPTQKPEKLLERIIKACSKEGDTVLDPFCGSGTTLVAAKKLGRNYVGIDSNADAIAITEQRLNEAR